MASVAEKKVTKMKIGGESAKPIKEIIKKSAEQLKVLEGLYSKNPKPSREARAELVARLGLTARQIQMWFCDKRKRDKKKMESIGISSVVDGAKIGGDESSSSASSSDSGLESKKKGITRPVLGISDKPVVNQWKGLPNLEHPDVIRLSGQKRKATHLELEVEQRISHPRVEKKYITEEAQRILNELRREAQRCRQMMEQCGDSQPKKKPQPIGVPSGSPRVYHGKERSRVGYAYCEETGQCFMITRLGYPAMSRQT